MISTGSEDWNPVVMIDKDRAERRAVLDVGFRFILCQAHYHKTFRLQVAISFQKGDKAMILKEIFHIERYLFFFVLSHDN